MGYLHGRPLRCGSFALMARSTLGGENAGRSLGTHERILFTPLRAGGTDGCAILRGQRIGLHTTFPLKRLRTVAVSAPAGSSSLSIPRITGVIGILGALLPFVGDMLLLGHFGPVSDFRAGMLKTIRSAPLARLWAGGLLGPVAGAMLLAGFWQVY